MWHWVNWDGKVEGTKIKYMYFLVDVPAEKLEK